MIYTAKPAQVANAFALLTSRGLHPEIHDDTTISLPWVSSGLPHVSLVVPDAEADEARALLDEIEVHHNAQAKVHATRVVRSLFSAAALLVGGAWVIIALRGARADPEMVGSVCVATGVLIVASLVRRGQRDAR